MTFNSLKLITNSIFLGNQSAYNCAGGIKSSFRLKTQFRRVTSVGPSTVRNVNAKMKHFVVYSWVNEKNRH